MTDYDDADRRADPSGCDRSSLGSCSARWRSRRQRRDRTWYDSQDKPKGTRGQLFGRGVIGGDRGMSRPISPSRRSSASTRPTVGELQSIVLGVGAGTGNHRNARSSLV